MSNYYAEGLRCKDCKSRVIVNDRHTRGNYFECEICGNVSPVNFAKLPNWIEENENEVSDNT